MQTPANAEIKRTTKPTETEVVGSASKLVLAPRTRSIITIFADSIKAAWQPQPLVRPIVDSDLTSLSLIERSAEVLRYQLLKVEYALSPGGNLREWLKLNLRIAVVLAILAIPIGILCSLVSFVLGEVAAWSALLLSTLLNILKAFVVCALIIAFLTGALFALRSLKR